MIGSEPGFSTCLAEALGDRLMSERVVTSGYLVTDEPTLAGYRRVERRELHGWAADVHERA